MKKDKILASEKARKASIFLGAASENLRLVEFDFMTAIANTESDSFEYSILKKQWGKVEHEIIELKKIAGALMDIGLMNPSVQDILDNSNKEPSQQ